MRKTTQNYVVNLMFGLLMLFQSVTGFILWFVVPGGYRYRGGAGAAAGSPVFLFDRHTWQDVHKWTALVLLVIFAVHIFMHWRWLFYMTKSYFQQGTKIDS